MLLTLLCMDVCMDGAVWEMRNSGANQVTSGQREAKAPSSFPSWAWGWRHRSRGSGERGPVEWERHRQQQRGHHGCVSIIVYFLYHVVI